MRQLRSILYDKELQHRMAEQAKVEAGKKKIEWGSQIRSYVFDDRRVKDHRTNYQTSDVNGVIKALGKASGKILEELDFPFAYSHQIPFPTHSRIDPGLINQAFHSIFTRAAAFL